MAALFTPLSLDLKGGGSGNQKIGESGAGCVGHKGTARGAWRGGGTRRRDKGDAGGGEREERGRDPGAGEAGWAGSRRGPPPPGLLGLD